MPLTTKEALAARVRDGSLLMRMTDELIPSFILAKDMYGPTDGGSETPWMRSIFFWPDEEGAGEVIAALRFELAKQEGGE